MFPSADALNVRNATADDAGAIASVHVLAWRESYAGLVPDAILSALDERARARYWSSVLEDPLGRTCVFVAEAAGTVVGFSAGGPELELTGKTGYQQQLYAIYLLKRAQGRGAGRRLFEAVAERLRSQGAISMMLWVFEQNSACGFYEAMGGKRIDARDEAFGGAMLREVAFGFDLTAAAVDH